MGVISYLQLSSVNHNWGSTAERGDSQTETSEFIPELCFTKFNVNQSVFYTTPKYSIHSVRCHSLGLTKSPDIMITDYTYECCVWESFSRNESTKWLSVWHQFRNNLYHFFNAFSISEQLLISFNKSNETIIIPILGSATNRLLMIVMLRTDLSLAETTKSYRSLSSWQLDGDLKAKQWTSVLSCSLRGR